MRAVVQRVHDASVSVEGDVVASIDHGLLVLVGVVPTDTVADAAALASKLTSMRIFPDRGGKMNRSVGEVEGAVLLVSQFTLVGDVRRGRRPSFSGAAHPDHARPIIDHIAAEMRGSDVPVASGRFGAHMNVSLTNWGPVTFVVDVLNGRIA